MCKAVKNNYVMILTDSYKSTVDIRTNIKKICNCQNRKKRKSNKEGKIKITKLIVLKVIKHFTKVKNPILTYMISKDFGKLFF
jgi:hypothetical protein